MDQQPRPDYARIRELEIELGMREQEAPARRAACECASPRRIDLVRMQDQSPAMTICGTCGGSIPHSGAG